MTGNKSAKYNIPEALPGYTTGLGSAAPVMVGTEWQKCFRSHVYWKSLSH